MSQDFQTDPVILIMICLGWAAMVIFFLAGRKVFFEPFKKTEETE